MSPECWFSNLPALLIIWKAEGKKMQIGKYWVLRSGVRPYNRICSSSDDCQVQHLRFTDVLKQHSRAFTVAQDLPGRSHLPTVTNWALVSKYTLCFCRKYFSFFQKSQNIMYIFFFFEVLGIKPTLTHADRI